MPNQPKTPSRNIRVDDVLWQAAKEAAAVNGTDISTVIRHMLSGYVGKTMNFRHDWHPTGWHPEA